tara:strand:+ start:2702 stop:3124 length:423 start_codon:yes stop_codon:yes gene_type:complete
MILKFFEKTEDLNKNNNNELINIACLMVHAAKIDENYTNKEREIIKNTLQKLNKSNQNIDKVFEDAEKREADANHIQEFTKNLKTMSKDSKKKLIENIWSIILSDGESDIYEENLMRRLAGLLYIDNKTMGEIKIRIKSK